MLIRGDARHLPLRDACVDCCVTSPPYFGLRDYGTATWRGGIVGCDHVDMAVGMSDKNTLGPTGHLPQTNAANVGRVRQYRDVCSKCGAGRIDNQIGLEPEIDGYVSKLVQVFAEVWRVLKPQGTVWLNLGDSYISNGRYESDKSTFAGGQERFGHLDLRPGARAIGLKPKDLCGIPWRVAFALQAPFYAGRIARVEDRIWLAAMLDAEGCMFIHKRKAGQHNGQGYYRQNDSYGPGLEIANTSLAVVERIMAIVGKGSICSQGPDQTNGRRRQTIYRWNLRTIESRDFVRELYPHLIAKQHQARLLYGCPSSGRDAERAHAGMMALHRGQETSIDFPAPESLFSPGYYLRSDVIWSKANPMPESVTDRPTKAHEYLFLLAKNERYYFDADAIREKHARLWDSAKPNGGTGRNGRGEGVMLGRATAPHCGIAAMEPHPDGRNKRSVWHVATMPYSGAHFATMPEKLVEPCILAGCPMGGLVLDPFVGSGTVVSVAERLGRRGVGVDLSYQDLAKERTKQRGLRFAVNE